MIVNTGGRTRIDWLVERSGLGARQFERRFHNQVGTSPKRYARIVRLGCALRLRRENPFRSWTNIAAEAGYADQAHMIHEFRALSGDRPERIFTLDAEWVNVVGMYWKGRDQIMFAQRAFHEGMFRRNQQELKAVQTRMLSPDIAVVMLDCLQDAYQTPSGHAMPQALDRLSLTVVRRPNGWRISHGQNTIVDANAAASDPVLRMPKL